MWRKLCTQIQHKYQRKNDSKIWKYSDMINIQRGLTKGRSFPSNLIPVFSKLV